MPMSEWKEKAEKAIEKPASLGTDIDLNGYSRNAKEWSDVSNLSELPEEAKKTALLAGVVSDEKLRCGTYFQLDHSVVFEKVREEFKGKIEIMNTKKAMEKYDWVKDYWWKAVPVDTDKYTAQAELEWDYGYFLRVLPGAKVTFPMQSCLFISQHGIAQNVHNLIIAEEGSEIQIITGCTAYDLRKGLHIGISEFFVKKNAKLTFTMVHRWAPKLDVRPRAVAILEDGATFTNNYICLNPVKSLQLYPTAYCNGKNSVANLNTIVLGAGDSDIDVGGRIVLRGENSRGQVLTRCVGKDSSKIHTRGQIIGESNGGAHIDCRGLIISDRANIYAIPLLDGLVKGCELSHEAAVGRIKDKELWYLMSRGLTEEEAISLIIKGYLDPGIFGLPGELEKDIKLVTEMSVKEVM